MKRGPSTVVLLLLAALFAGCVSSESAAPDAGANQAPPTASAAEFDETTGAITGIVTNDEAAPLPGAVVGLLGAEMTTLTAQDGRYTLSNLEPGQYTVNVAVLGYQSAARLVTVLAGEQVQANFLLVAVPIDEPFYESQQQLGNIQCSVTFFPGVPLTGFIAPGWYTGVQVCGVVGVPTLPPSKFILTFNVTQGTEEILLEMKWESTQVLGSGLSIIVEHPNGVNNGQPIFGSKAGKSPLVVYANRTKVLNVTGAQDEDYAECDGCRVITRAFSAANTTEFYLPVAMPAVPPFGAPSNKVDAGFALDQKNEQWMTFFVRMEKPLEFSALPDV